MNKKGLVSRVATGALTFGLPLLAMAQAYTLPSSPATNVTGLITKVCSALGIVFALLVVLTIIFVLVAAFKYLTAAGDPEKVKDANYILAFAAIALIVAVFAKGFPSIVDSIVGSTITKQC